MAGVHASIPAPKTEGKQGDRQTAKAIDIASFLGLGAETVHATSLGTQFIVSVKPDPGYSELVACLFEFCAVRLDHPLHWMSAVDCEMTLERSTRRFRWLHSDEMKQNPAVNARGRRRESRGPLFLLNNIADSGVVGALWFLAVGDRH